MSNIHPTAIIEPGAKIGKNVTIEAYAVIKGTVTLEDEVVIKSHVYLDGNTTVGLGTTIWPGASIGTKTQDRKFKGETTYVVIGKHCEIREFVTINSSCQEGSTVKVGDHCLIMAYSHVAHNCEIGNHVILSNNAALAGHVIIEDHVIIGGMTPVHQFVRIGRFAMVGGFSRITRDIPPFTIGAGAPYRLGGLNLIGLKRNDFSLEERKALTRAFKLTYRSGLHLEDALKQLAEEEKESPSVAHWVRFCRLSKRGLISLEGITKGTKEEPAPVSTSTEELKEYETLLEE